MGHRIGAHNENISEVVLNISLKRLMNFEDDYNSGEYLIRGTPWFIRFSKKSEGASNFLAVYLHYNWEHDSPETMIVATCDVVLIPADITSIPHKGNIHVNAFDAYNSRWGLDKFIEWNRMIDPINGYMDPINDTCLFRIIVQATPVLNAHQNEFLTLEELTIDEHGKFRMTIHQLHNVIGVCSPTIYFDGSSWRIIIHRSNQRILIAICNTGTNPRRLSAEFQLLSSDPKIQSKTAEVEDHEFNSVDSFGKRDLITWNEFIDHANNFLINDSSFVIEIKLKAGQVEPST